jgi:hypothetical protein
MPGGSRAGRKDPVVTWLPGSFSTTTHLLSCWDRERFSRMPHAHLIFLYIRPAGPFDDALVADEGNDERRPMTLGAGEEIHFRDLLYQPCPVLAVLLG